MDRINNNDQLILTREALQNCEDALIALKEKLYHVNPELFKSMSHDAYKSIIDMRADIDLYMGIKHSDEVGDFIDLVEETRLVQKEYFKTRLKDVLRRSKQLEQQVDQKILALKKRRK